MIIKEYKAPEPSGGRIRIFVDIKCDCCGSVYTRQKRFVKEHQGCSAKCLAVLKGSRVKTSCRHCNKEIFKPKSDIKASKSGFVFCDRKCKEAAQKYLKEIQPDHYGEGTSRYRQRALKYYGAVCMDCGYDSNIAAIQVHHKDHNRLNNSIENLEVLCANCHAIKHFGGTDGC